MKNVIGYEQSYKVTSDGKVYRLITRGGLKLKEPKKIKDWDNNGYRQVRLSFGGKRKAMSIHRLVAIAYLPNPDNLPFINHINGVKSDNRVENLEWCTASHNSKENFRLGRQTPLKGSDCSWSKLTEVQVNEIRAKYIPRKYSCMKLAKEYGVSQQSVSDIILNKIWRV